MEFIFKNKSYTWMPWVILVAVALITIECIQLWNKSCVDKYVSEYLERERQFNDMIQHPIQFMGKPVLDSTQAIHTTTEADAKFMAQLLTKETDCFLGFQCDIMPSDYDKKLCDAEREMKYLTEQITGKWYILSVIVITLLAFFFLNYYSRKYNADEPDAVSYLEES